MRLKRILLDNFRNYPDFECEFEGQVTKIIGNNGKGKTNLLEAIHVLAVGKSIRADNQFEVVKSGQEVARVKGVAQIDDGESELEVIWDRREGGGKKLFRVDGAGKRMVDFASRLVAVFFRPEDLGIVAGSPSGRRQYLDLVLGQVNVEYRRNLLAYERAIRQRNRLLVLIREGKANRSQLFFWDRVVCKNGEFLNLEREKYVEFLNGFGDEFRVEYDKSAISEFRLKQYEREEVAAGVTLVGPHRDDLILKLVKDGEGERDLKKFGSRGEQRMAVLWLKVKELEYIEKIKKVRPILLLDDIFSELDQKHRDQVWRMSEGRQTFVSGVEPEAMDAVDGQMILF